MANSQMSDHGDKYTKKEKKGILERKKNKQRSNDQKNDSRKLLL